MNNTEMTWLVIWFKFNIVQSSLDHLCEPQWAGWKVSTYYTRTLPPFSYVSGYNFIMTCAYDHTTLNAPVLIWSPKLSSVGPVQYLDGWPPGNHRCCRLHLYFLFNLRLFATTCSSMSTTSIQLLLNIGKHWACRQCHERLTHHSNGRTHILWVVTTSLHLL